MGSESRARRRRLFVGLAISFVVSVALFAYAVYKEPASNTLLYEGAKVLPQVGLVSVAGAILSYLVFEYQRSQQRSDSQRTFLADILSTATTAYSDLKRSRRMFRGLGLRYLDGEKMIIVNEYDALINEINSAQLQFEGLVQDVATTTEAFTDPGACIEALRGIEAALHSVISEYETSRPIIEDPQFYPLEHLPCLSGFLARQSEDETAFRSGFFVVTKHLWLLRSSIRFDLSQDFRKTGGRRMKAVRTLDEGSRWRYPPQPGS